MRRTIPYGKGCASALGEVLEDFASIVRERTSGSQEVAAREQQTRRVTYDLFTDVLHELTPKGREMLRALCEAEEPLSRSTLAERLSVAETATFTLLRSIRLIAHRKRCQLETLTNRGYRLTTNGDHS